MDQILSIPSGRIGSLISVATDVALQKRLAAKSDSYPFLHGAILFKGPRIYSTGFNQPRYVRWPHLYGVPTQTMHAEVACIHGIPDETFQGKDILVVRINRSGDLANSKPCNNCQRLMKLKGIRRCYYSIGPNQLGLMSLK